MKEKVLVLGDTGMLGHTVYNYLKEESCYETIGTDRLILDAEDSEDNLETILKGINPNYVVNCIGIINKYCDDNEEKAWQINSVFPHTLSRLGDKLDYKLIHISSDCVFDDNLYGKSKYAGEVDSNNHITIRSSIIGPELKDKGLGLFDWFMRQKTNTDGYVNHKWNGVSTLELSKFIESVIDNYKLYHENIIDVRAINPITKYDLLNNIKKVFNKNITINKKETEVVDKTTPPEDSYDEQIYILNSYDSQLNDMKKWIDRHSNLYGDKY